MNIASRPLVRRLAHLHQAIGTGSYPNATTLAKEQDVTTRTIYRDIEVLRTELNAPVLFCPRRNGFYYTEPNYSLPLFEFSQGELIAVFLAERVLQQYRGLPFVHDLVAAFRKMTAGLPDKVAVNLDHLAEACSIQAPEPSEVATRLIPRLVRATLEGQQLELLYWTASRDTQVWRKVDPYHLVSIKGEWYLIGFCHLREEVRMFAPGRIKSLKQTGAHFERPADFRIEEYLEGSFGAMRGAGALQAVKLRFTAQAGRYVREKLWHPSQKVRTRRDGRVELSLRVNELYEVKRWVLSYGPECEVLAPAELRREVAEELRRAASCYAVS